MSMVERSVARKAKRSDRKAARPQTGPGEWHPFAGPRWMWAAGLILLLTAVLRFYDLPLAPLHHDEGVNGQFLTHMFRGEVYHYDPANYHGPTLYYFALILSTLNAFVYGKAGLSTFVIRAVPALFGTATVWLILRLRRHLGDHGALAAALLAALSPGMVYFSRYFIHEMLLVFFTLGIVVALLEYYETARPRCLLLASASAALMFATKETAIFGPVVLLIAGGMAWLYVRVAGKPQVMDEEQAQPSLRVRAGGGWWLAGWLAGAALLFAVIYIAFYSSFGGNYPKGIYDSFATFGYWSQTGTSAHTHKFYSCLKWLGQEEWLLVCLGLIGLGMAVYRRNRFAIFSGLWALGMASVYSLIPYKTPWLLLNIVLPLALAGGYGVAEILGFARRSSRVWGRGLLLLALAAPLVVSTVRAVDLSFYSYDDDSRAYVYAHTRRSLLALLRQVEEFADRAGTGTETGITITSPNHWPLPWYLRDYPRAGFWGKVVPTQQPIVIGQSDQDEELRRTLGEEYLRIGFYDLRPGVTLILYARRDLLQ